MHSTSAAGAQCACPVYPRRRLRRAPGAEAFPRFFTALFLLVMQAAAVHPLTAPGMAAKNPLAMDEIHAEQARCAPGTAGDCKTYLSGILSLCRRFLLAAVHGVRSFHLEQGASCSKIRPENPPATASLHRGAALGRHGDAPLYMQTKQCYFFAPAAISIPHDRRNVTEKRKFYVHTC